MYRFGWFSRFFFFPFIHSQCPKSSITACVSHTRPFSPQGVGVVMVRVTSHLVFDPIDCEYAICRGNRITLIGVDQASLSLDWKAALCRT